MNHRKPDIGADSIRLAGTLQHVASPMAAAAVDYPDGCFTPPQRHRRAQLLYAISGVMTVYTAEGAWVVPANRGVWVPPETEHSILNSGLVQLRTVYIEPNLARHMPAHCAVIQVSPLLRELLIAALDMPLDQAPRKKHMHVMKLILEEIRTLPVLPLYLPIPGGSVIAQSCRDIIDFPGAPHALATWSRRLGLSSRTLERHFNSATGMTFSRWRQQARIIASLPLLARGDSILEIALELGDDSPSAFAAMFRRALGVTPSAYFSDAEPPGASHRSNA